MIFSKPAMFSPQSNAVDHNVYDLQSEENVNKWRGLLKGPLQKVGECLVITFCFGSLSFLCLDRDCQVQHEIEDYLMAQTITGGRKIDLTSSVMQRDVKVGLGQQMITQQL